MEWKPQRIDWISWFDEGENLVFFLFSSYFYCDAIDNKINHSLNTKKEEIIVVTRLGMSNVLSQAFTD